MNRLRRLAGPLLLILLAGGSLLAAQHRGSAAGPPSPPAAAAIRLPAGTAAAAPVPPTGPTTRPTGGPSSGAAAGPAATPAATPSGTTQGNGPAGVPDGAGDPEPAGAPVPPGAAAAPRDTRQAARFARAAATATGFMTAFARPPNRVNAAGWWAGVKRYLAARAVADYAGTDPGLVPFTRLTGPARVVPTDAPADLLIAVRVPTDAGVYRVELETGRAGMRVARAVPPDPAGLR